MRGNKINIVMRITTRNTTKKRQPNIPNVPENELDSSLGAEKPKDKMGDSSEEFVRLQMALTLVPLHVPFD